MDRDSESVEQTSSRDGSELFVEIAEAPVDHDQPPLCHKPQPASDSPASSDVNNNNEQHVLVDDPQKWKASLRSDL